MNEKDARLLDATRRLLKDKSNDREIIQSLMDIGITESKATDMLELAKQGRKETRPSPDSFWESSSDFFGRGKAAPKPGFELPGLSGKAAGKSTMGETAISETGAKKRGFKHVEFREVLPVRVSNFDRLITRGGLKRGDTILLSGGAGTGKTTFGMQSLYNGTLNWE